MCRPQPLADIDMLETVRTVIWGDIAGKVYDDARTVISLTVLAPGAQR